MKTKPKVQEPKKETREHYKARVDHSESQYVRDMAFMRRMDEGRASVGKGGLAGF